jgi:hypothetical protein
MQIIDRTILPLAKELLGKLIGILMDELLFGFLSLLSLGCKMVWVGVING